MRILLAAAVLLFPAAPSPAAEGPPGPDPAALEREAEAEAKARRFPAAGERFAAAVAAAPSPGERDRLEGRREDAALAARGIEALAAAVSAHPDRFARVALTKAVSVNLQSADPEALLGVVQGAPSRMPWGSLDRAVLANLVERSRIEGPDLLPLAALLQEAGAEDEAEQTLLRFLRGGGDPSRAARALARWRREDPPRGGYVEHGGRLHTPGDRDRLLLEDRKAAAWQKLLSEDGAKRREGFEDLKGLGEPGRWTLYKGLRARRAQVAARLLEMKVFAAPATRARLRAELERRRAEALALIEDPRKYPYPNPGHRGQAEVDRLVALVREAWSNPFDVVAGWDPAVAAEVRLVGEVDGWIASVEEGYEPDMAAVKGPVNALLDVPGMVPDEYSAKVLEYNAKVRTSADPEERENVLAVNEYRMLLGRPAVKIHERLVRAARGHSIHMRRNGYFSHDSVEPGLETPGKRAARQGYAGGVGENISAGRPTGRGAFDGWYGSSGHHRNMVAAGWTEMGAGRSHSLFTQLFGRLTGKSLVEPDPLPPPGPDVAPDPPPGE